MRGLLTGLWDKRRRLPPYARNFSESLAAHMRDVFPISQPRAPKTGRGAKRARARSEPQADPEIKRPYG